MSVHVDSLPRRHFITQPFSITSRFGKKRTQFESTLGHSASICSGAVVKRRGPKVAQNLGLYKFTSTRLFAQRYLMGAFGSHLCPERILR